MNLQLFTIDYAFFQRTRLIDSNDKDDAAKILPMSSIHDMILTATAHQKILEKHIGGLQLLVDDESLFTGIYMILLFH